MTPVRTTLSVPGHREKMQLKARASKADVIMLDLEDSVPPDMKAAARQTVVRALTTHGFGDKGAAVRVNALDTPFGFRDVLQVVEAAGQAIDFLVLPKVNHEGDIHFLDRLLSGIEMEQNRARPVGIEASIETAQGLDRVSAIAGASPRLRSLSFGVADYAASVGAPLTSLSGHGENEPSGRWHFPMSRMVMAAKARGLLAIDAPFGDFRDPRGLKASAIASRSLGCDGKWVIHPDQIDVVNQVFTPDAREIARAGKILEAAGQAGPHGAVAVEGKMVDQATVRLARICWSQAAGLGLVTPPD